MRYRRTSNGTLATLQDRDGVILAIPVAINPGSPVFKHAAAACAFTL